LKYIRFVLILAGFAWVATLQAQISADAISSPDVESRLRAVAAVASTDDPIVLLALERRMRDTSEDDRVRLHAARALLASNHPGAEAQMDVLLSIAASNEVDGADNIVLAALAPKGDDATDALTQWHTRGDIDDKFYQRGLFAVGTPKARELAAQVGQELADKNSMSNPYTHSSRVSGYYRHRSRNPEVK
jgi:hypothetical protein